MSVISIIQDFIITECPCLSAFDDAFAEVPKLELDVLDENALNFMISPTPSEPIVKRYANGDTRRRITFDFCSRTFYGGAENIDTSEFYEAFTAWMDEVTMTDALPDLGEGKESIRLRATTDGYLMDAETNLAQYRVQCEFIYLSKRS